MADDSAPPGHYLPIARSLYGQGQYFRAARYAFGALENERGSRPAAYALAAISLIHARLYNSATYFFIRTLQSGDREAIRQVLPGTQDLFLHVSPDLLRKYLIRHTQYDDYDAMNRSAYLYSLGKDALLSGQNERAIGYLNGISEDSPIWPFALELRGSAYAIKGDGEMAIEDFRSCVRHAAGITRGYHGDSPRHRQAENEADDLASRCQADVARTLYQMDRFEAADRAYDRIPKSSLVWPEILFEQAWNSFARQEYNRSLGKLVSYKSPLLSFVFNPEIDVLRAQSYLALCLYDDANDVINEFNGRYASIGEGVKGFVEGHNHDLEAFYQAGRSALRDSIYSKEGMNPMLNQFVRGPYFVGLVRSEADLAAEQAAIVRFDRIQTGGRHDPSMGFPGFLTQVLNWRRRTIHSLGGIFVKNSLMDYHSSLISDFEKMSFIKLEMLKRAKDLLVYRHRKVPDRSWGNVKPERRSYQYYWTFNGEFWLDELGDYVFGLESECGRENHGT